MSTLKQRLTDDMKVAMRDKNALQLDTIRLVRAAIQRKEVDDRVELGEQEVIGVIQKLVKQCTDAATQFDAAGRDDLAARERGNIAIMESYLPLRLSDQEVDEIIDAAIQKTGATSMKEMGQVMGVVRGELQGRADMAAVSATIKNRLSS